MCVLCASHANLIARKRKESQIGRKTRTRGKNVKWVELRVKSKRKSCKVESEDIFSQIKGETWYKKR